MPAAFLGAYLLHLMGGSKVDQEKIEIVLGTALLVGAGAMVLRMALDRRAGNTRTAVVHEVVPRPLPTVAIGIVGGLIVGMTSVGSGSLMIVMMLFLYPALGASQLVGTDLTQAVPLTAAAALGALAFGHVDFGVTTSLGHRQRPRGVCRLALLLLDARPLRPPRDRVRDLRLRPEVRGVEPTALGWILCATLLACGGLWLARARPRSAASGTAESAGPASEDPATVADPEPAGVG